MGHWCASPMRGAPVRGRLDLIYPEPTDLTGPELTDAEARRLYGLMAEAIAEQGALEESPPPARPRR